jgi:hypothetical protein
MISRRTTHQLVLGNRYRVACLNTREPGLSDLCSVELFKVGGDTNPPIGLTVFTIDHKYNLLCRGSGDGLDRMKSVRLSVIHRKLNISYYTEAKPAD